MNYASEKVDKPAFMYIEFRKETPVTESLSIDQIIEHLLKICRKYEDIPHLKDEEEALKAIHSRLSGGELHVAIVGQFNRGKSTFINRLLEIDLLPVSVLPLTAIPTEIRYGNTNQLQITLTDEERVYSDVGDIEDALLSYVTEENNPENKKGVTAVRLSAPSPLLSHGTTIIDTPGFGSTHIHNTKATLNVLKECDAVFFLLSADLPITQMELNFIKKIAPQVTRLFFIYNKTDILNKEEVETTSDFIRAAVEKQLNMNISDRFFQVSAKIAATDREASGLTAIEGEVLDFLQREKYFSLAEAIRIKLNESRQRMISSVALALSNLSDQQIEIEKEYHRLTENEILKGEQIIALKELQNSKLQEKTEIGTIFSALEKEYSSRLNETEKVNRYSINKVNRRIELHIVEQVIILLQNRLSLVEKSVTELLNIEKLSEPLPLPSLERISETLLEFPFPTIIDQFRSRKSLESVLLQNFSLTVQKNCSLITNLCDEIFAELKTEVIDKETNRIVQEMEVIQEKRSTVHKNFEKEIKAVTQQQNILIELQKKIEHLKV